LASVSLKTISFKVYTAKLLFRYAFYTALQNAMVSLAASILLQTCTDQWDEKYWRANGYKLLVAETFAVHLARGRKQRNL